MDLQKILSSTTLDELSLKDCLTLQSTETVQDAIFLMRENKRGSAVVANGETLVGIFTERDFLRTIHAGTSLETPLESVMTGNPQTVNSTDHLSAAVTLMGQGRYRRLPVLKEGRPVGMLDVKAIVSFLVEHFPQAVYNQAARDQLIPNEREGA